MTAKAQARLQTWNLSKKLAARARSADKPVIEAIDPEKPFLLPKLPPPAD